MKRNIVLTIMLMTIGAVSFAQDKTSESKVVKVSKFSEGSSLSASDVGFLNMVVNGSSSSRGHADNKEVTVGKNKLTAGSKLSKEDASLISQKVTEFEKTNKGEKAPSKKDDKARGYCYYYYYCDGYGYCAYYYTCY